jgi:large subunit ribosomal protein L35
MPKMKRHKGLAKRFKVSATGKVRYDKNNAGHLMTGKGGTRRRRLRKKDELNNSKLAARIRRLLLA